MGSVEDENTGLPKSTNQIIRGLQIVLAIVSSWAVDCRGLLTVGSALLVSSLSSTHLTYGTLTLFTMSMS